MTPIAIGPLNFAERVPLVWDTWLKQYFDPQDETTHTVMGSGLAFPAATILHDQQAGPMPDGLSPKSGQPMSENRPAVEIHAINQYGHVETTQAGTGEDGYREVRTLFVIRARVGQGQASTNSIRLCRTVAERLDTLLQSPTAIVDLARCGLGNLEVIESDVQSPAEVMTRTIRVKAELAYEIPS